jgi:transcriptional regulator with XRE-family HTH domain
MIGGGDMMTKEEWLTINAFGRRVCDLVGYEDGDIDIAAERTGIDRRQIEAMKGTARNVNYDVVQGITRGFGVSLDYMIGWRKDPEPEKTDEVANYSQRIKEVAADFGGDYILFSAAVGLSTTVLYGLASGRNKPRLLALVAIAGATNTRLDWLIGRDCPKEAI